MIRQMTSTLVLPTPVSHGFVGKIKIPLTLNQKTTLCFPADRRALAIMKLIRLDPVVLGGGDTRYLQDRGVFACIAISSAFALARVRVEVASIQVQGVSA
jgi:hypothetical protein